MEGDQSLSANARKIIEDEENIKYISIASMWEISIKISLGKLFLKTTLEEFFTSFYFTDIKVLPISFSHLLRLGKMEFLHKDPFDRLIISQSLEDNLIVVGKDPNFPLYKVDLHW